MRPRRSVLYLPGSNLRAIEKAKTLDADAIILDLEDSVAPEEKAAARDQVCDAVKSGGFGFREVIIRINGWTTPYGRDDFAKALSAGPDAILVPKIDAAFDLAALRDFAAGHDAMNIALWAMIETPLAIMNLNAIGAAAKADVLPLTCFVLGTNDLVKATGVRTNTDRTALLAWLSMTVIAAKAYGLDVIDGVYNDLGNEQGLRQECEQGRLLGMTGKTLIHPNQIAPANAAFAPSEAEVEDARTIAGLFDLPENAGKGVVRHNGRMVERLHAEMAKRTLMIADAMRSNR
jgi:citrate lyase subunit beta/citryl-CoA lyase